MFRILVILLFLSACTVEPRLEYTTRVATVLILTENNRYGTGVLVSHDKILTANHVVNRDQVVVAFYKGKSVVSTVTWRSDNVDLALLEIQPAVDISPVVVACQLPEIGTPVFIIGQSAYRVPWSARYGKVASSDVDPDGSLILYMTAASGDSGAGVFDYNGRLVGILETIQFSRSMGNEGFSFMIPGSKICEELVDKL